MRRAFTRYRHGLLAGCALAAALAVPAANLLSFQGEEPSGSLVIYLEDGPLVSEARDRVGATYVSILELADRLGLPHAHDADSDTLTIRGPRADLEVVNNSNAVRLGPRTVRMRSPVIRDGDGWWAPIEFLTLPLADASGVRFRYEAGRPRIFAGNVAATLLDMDAAPTGDGTRLTIRAGRTINVRVQQDRDNDRVVLSVDRAPFDPRRESLDYRDGTVQSVRFDDSDGSARIVVGTRGQLANLRLVPADGNRTFHVDFVPADPVARNTVAAAPAPDQRRPVGALRVVAIDAGHGGLDSGTAAHGTLEKDLTLALARRLRAALENRLDAAFVLTRDEDRDLSHEERAAIANNSGADLLISLHVGYSMDPTESAASVFVMHAVEERAAPAAGDALFRPWYRAWEGPRGATLRLAEILHRRLEAAIPRWEFSVRRAPVGLLASTAMPSVVIELGNANNASDLDVLTSNAFQDRFASAVLEAIEAYGRGERL